jgi:hypothetical protein
LYIVPGKLPVGVVPLAASTVSNREVPILDAAGQVFA